MILGHFSEHTAQVRLFSPSKGTTVWRDLYEYTLFDGNVPSMALYQAKWLYHTEDGRWIKDTKNRPSNERIFFYILKAKKFGY